MEQARVLLEEDIKELGDILRFIRVKVFGLSLLDFGELIGLSSSSYQRYENNLFGKAFDKNKYLKLKTISDAISKAVFEDLTLYRKSKMVSVNKQSTKIDFNLKLKAMLNEIYRRVFAQRPDHIAVLERHIVDNKENFQEYLYLFFLLFSEKSADVDINNIIVRTEFDGNSKKLFSEKARAEFEKESRIKRLSLGLSMCEEDDSVFDNLLLYNQICRFDFFDIDSGDYKTVRYLDVINTSDEPVNFIIHREYGENKVHFSKMEIIAVDEWKNKLFVENMVNVQPCIIQTFKIHFNNALRPNERIRIYFKFKWVQEVAFFSEEIFNTSISLLRYKKGLGVLKFGVFSKYKSTGIFIEEISHEYESSQLELLHKKTDENILNEFKEIFEDEVLKLSGFHYEIDKPGCLGYRIHFKPLVKTTTI